MRSVRLILITAALMCVGASCKPKEDTSPVGAYEAGDTTLVMSGGGHRSLEGVLPIKAAVGQLPTAEVTVIHPEDAKCSRDSCATLFVIRQDGSEVEIGGIPAGESEMRFPLSKVLGSDAPIEKAQGGPYRLLLEYYYDLDGEEYQKLAAGRLYLVVTDSRYVALGCDSPDVAWVEKLSKHCVAEWTTKYRSAICPTQPGGCD